jgi:hypothetical protein
LAPGFNLDASCEDFGIKRSGLRLTITLSHPCTLHDDAIARKTKAAFYLQGARLINLQRHGKDPDALWLSYIPVLDLVRKMCSDIWNMEGFVLKPQVKVQEVRRTAKGGMETIREYDHPSTGTWWQDAQEEVSM